MKGWARVPGKAAPGHSSGAHGTIPWAGRPVAVPGDFLFWCRARVVNVVDGDTLDLEIGAPLLALCR